MSVMTPLFEHLWDHYILWSVIVGVIAFGWLYHHSFWFTSKDGENLPNVDAIEIGVFPKHNDDMRLEVAWTILPFLLIVWLTYFSWESLDSIWTSADGGDHGYECEEGESSENWMRADGIMKSDCYHVIEITGQQWFWSFDCLELNDSICDTGTDTMEVYGSVPVLSLKKGETYLAVMESVDVTHAPWFQHLGNKEDILPGQQTTLWLTISESMAEESMVLCAEYCGDAHSIMAAKLVAHN